MYRADVYHLQLAIMLPSGSDHLSEVIHSLTAPSDAIAAERHGLSTLRINKDCDLIRCDAIIPTISTMQSM